MEELDWVAICISYTGLKLSGIVLQAPKAHLLVATILFTDYIFVLGYLANVRTFTVCLHHRSHDTIVSLHVKSKAEMVNWIGYH